MSVTGVRLTTPDVEGVAATDKGRILRAGVDRDFSVALGDPVCDDDDLRAGARGGRPDGRRGRRSTVVVEPTDPQGHLARIHGEDCAGVAVAAGATLTLADTITTTDVDGTLVANVDARASTRWPAVRGSRSRRWTGRSCSRRPGEP